MKKQFLIPVLCAWFLALFCVTLILSRQARGQVASTSISVGFNATLKADADKFLAIPPCSLSAHCVAQLQLCNTNSSGVADSAHCILINANGQAPWSTTLWIGVSQTTTSATGSSTVPFGFGTVAVSVPNNEVSIVP